MNKSTNKPILDKPIMKQRGAALIMTLVLLVVALTLGLFSYQSSLLQESMAGNYRASSSALMAAEYAASEAWIKDFRGVVDPGASSAFVAVELPQEKEYANLGAYYYYQKSGNGLYRIVAIGELQHNPSVFRYVEYVARLAVGPGAALVAASGPPHPDDDCELKTTIIPAASNAGFIGQEVFGSLKAAIQVGCVDAARALIENITNKDASKVSRESDTNPDIQICIDAPNNRFCNYEGGIRSSIDIDIFKNPGIMAEFIDSLRANLWFDEWQLDNASPSTPDSVVHNLDDANGRTGVTFLTPTTWVPNGDNFDINNDGYENSSHEIGGNYLWVDYRGEKLLLNPVGDVNGDGTKDDFDRKEIISNTVDVGGSGVQPRVTYATSGQFSGSGVLIIDGNVSFKGVPNFDGLLIVLGDYTVTGGGGGAVKGEFNGSVVSAPITGENEAPEFDTAGYGNSLACYISAPTACGFDSKKMKIGGGGGSQYNHDLDALLNAIQLLEDTGASAGGQTARELFAYRSDNKPSGFYITNYRQPFQRPRILIDYIENNPDIFPGD